jgi:Family of unknown function (DUF6600)/FecR protein
MTRSIRKSSILAVLLAGAAILPAWAQQAEDQGYAPEHGVARISVVNGDVSVRRGDSGDLSAAALNGPLVANDDLATGQDGRAEIQFDWGNMIRLGPQTEVRMGELEDRHFLVQIAAGTTTFRVLRDSGADVEISTPTVSIRPAGEGSYRVSVDPDGATEITVRSGRAEIFSPRGSEILNEGSTMEARGNPSDPEYMIVAAIPQDEWDFWNVDRDRALESSSSYRYVSPDIVGAEDLDPYGRWTTDPQYGQVWVPTVDADWAPYRVGRWVDEDYYGWTWISGDPWGWAPYHYGNWYMSSFGWAWYPGSIYERQYWRPALVGFFGWGSGGYGGGFGVGFGYGNVGWVPLAPHERFRPWYGRGYNNTNIINNARVENDYRNARFANGRNGVTSINSRDFGRGRSINTNNFVRASRNDLVRTGSVQGRLPFNATAESRRMSDRQVNAQSLPRVNANTRFATRGGTATRGATQAGGANQGANQGRPAQTFGPSNGGVRGNNNNGNAGGFRQFGGTAPSNNRGQANGISRTPAPQVNRGQVDRGNNSNGPGWRSFGGATPSAPAVIGGGRNNARTAPAPARSFPQSQRTAPQTRSLPQSQRTAPAPQQRSFPQSQRTAPAPQQRSYPQSQRTAPAPQQRSFPQNQRTAPAPQRSYPQQERQQFRQSAPQQPVRVSPPIVRERGPSPSASRSQAPSAGGGGGGNRSSGSGNRGNGGGRRR